MKANWKPASIVDSFAESATLALAARAKRMKAEGRRIINFAAGEPDFNTPSEIIDAAFSAAKAGATKYTAVAGAPEARKAIAARLTEDYGVAFDADSLVLSNGGKQSIFHFLQASLEPGDEVLIPAPYWTSFPEMVKLAGGQPVIVRPENGRLEARDLQRKITENTRVFILNSPCNPSGVTYSEQEVASFLEVIKPHPIWLMSDDTYYSLVYEPTKWVSALCIDSDFIERSCVIGSLSKSYAMTGWRLGWASVPSEMKAGMVKLQGQVSSGASSITQAAAVDAVGSSHQKAAEFRKIFDGRRRLVMELVEKASQLSCLEPQGAFYAFIRLSEALGGEDKVTAFCERLLEEKGVCLVPGEAFGAPAFARLSYALGEDDIRDGIQLLIEALA